MPSISEMRTVSVLEQRIETSGVSQATADLDRLATAQKGAAAGANDLAVATDTATKRVTSLREQAERQWLGLDQGAKATKRFNDEVAKTNRFLGGGALGSGDAAQAEADKRIALIQARYERERASLNDNIRGGGTHRALRGDQLANLSFQANDILTGLATGQSPAMIAAQQGGQVFQILQSSSKGAGAAVMELGGMIGRFLVNPLTLAAGAIGATALAWRQYSIEQEAARRSLEGIGRASGLTLSGLNKIADSTSGMSAGNALSMAGTYAGAGLNGDLVGRLTGSATKKYADFTAQSLGDASAELAKAFADPVRGLDSLSSKMGFLDATTRETVRSFMRQGDVMAAQRTAFDAFNKSIDQVVSRKGAIRSVWETVWNTGANAVSAVGSIGAPLPLDVAVERARLQVENLQKLADQNKRFGSIGLGRPGAGADNIGAAKDRLFDAQEMLRNQGIMEQIARANGELERSRTRGLQGEDAIRATLPELDALQKLIDKQKLLDAVRKDPNSGLKVGAEAQAKAYDAVSKAIESTLTAEEKLRRTGDLAAQGIMARTASERLAVEMARTRLDMAGKELTTVQRQISERNTLNRALAESGRLLQDAARQARDEAGMVGLSPLARALRENENRTRDLREQTLPAAGLPATGLSADFSTKLKAFMDAVGGLSITSGFRSVDRQQQLWDAALQKYGTPDIARKWVAPPGSSQHNFGLAADLGFATPDARARAHTMAAQFGLTFPLGNEPWHIEPVGGRGMRGSVAGLPGTSADAIGGQRARNIIDEATSVDLKRQSDELDRQNALWRIRANMVGQGDDAINRAIKYQELLNAATTKGVSAATIGDEAWRRYAAGLGALADKSVQVDKAQESLRKTVEQMDLLRDVSKGALSSFTNDLIAGKSAAQALQGSLQGVLSKLLDMAENQLIASLFGKSGGLGGGLLGSLLGFGGGGGVGAPLSIVPSANGNVFGPSGVHAFALGGAFSNSIVNRPTLFPFANGTGLMGEAGPEAIMPLRRGPDGRLGVSGSGGGGGTAPNVNVSIQNYSGAKVEQKSERGSDGSTNMTFLIKDLEDTLAQRASRQQGSLRFAGRNAGLG